MKVNCCKLWHEHWLVCIDNYRSFYYGLLYLNWLSVVVVVVTNVTVDYTIEVEI